MISPDAIEKSSLMLKIHKTLNFYVNMMHLRWRDFIWQFANPEFERPIFIVGCSRAGTTVVYKVLSMAKGLKSMNKESHDFWINLHPPSEKNWDSHILTEKDVSERDKEEISRFYFRNLGGKRFVDKANLNCFTIPYLLALFPDAFFVYVKRDGRDNINSLIHGWGRPDEYATWSRNLPVDVEIENNSYKHWCFFLFSGWRSFLRSSVEEVCAHQWIAANQAMLASKKGVPQGQWIEVLYEDILKSAADTFREIYKKIDLPFTDSIKRHCETLVANPYNAFSTPRLEKWKEENRERIERIIPLITPTMIQMGYEL